MIVPSHTGAFIFGLALPFILPQPRAGAAQLFGAHDYGVGIYLSPSHSPSQLVEDWARAGTREVYSPPFQLRDAPLELYEAGAKLDFVHPSEPRQYPVVGARAEVYSKDGDDRVELEVGSVAYTGLTVLGLTDPVLPLSITLEGSFLDYEPVPGDGLADMEADINIYDNQGRTLAQAVLGGSGNSDSFAWYCDAGGDPGFCTDPHRVWVLRQSSRLPWTSGKIELPFNLPVQDTAAGVIIDLWVKAKIDSRGDLIPGGLGAKANFIDTVSLSMNLPPGVTVTMATGEIFGGPISVAGDVNHDGTVDCQDIALVKASFGKKVGQIGFDSRADVNSDGVIDIRDLAFVAQHLPTGTRCL